MRQTYPDSACAPLGLPPQYMGFKKAVGLLVSSSFGAGLASARMRFHIIIFTKMLTMNRIHGRTHQMPWLSLPPNNGRLPVDPPELLFLIIILLFPFPLPLFPLPLFPLLLMAHVGNAVGVSVGAAVDGVAVGCADGTLDGPAVGVAVGIDVGCPVGAPVGVALGEKLGTEVGTEVGEPVGTLVGANVVGTSVGAVVVGMIVGAAVGGAVGMSVGDEDVGLEVRHTDVPAIPEIAAIHDGE
jgi:hypothetical protein